MRKGNSGFTLTLYSNSKVGLPIPSNIVCTHKECVKNKFTLRSDKKNHCI